MRAIIIGGGIGGITAAIALRRAGVDVAVHERAPEPREVGAGISLWSNAIRALRKIDAAEHVLGAGRIIEIGEFRTAKGRVMQRGDFGAEDRRLGAPSIIIHRADLLAALLDHVPPEIVHFNALCIGVEEDQSGVNASFEDGSTARGDLLIGADGLNSIVRRSLWGPHPPRYSGYTCWRGIAQVSALDLAAGYVCESWGPAARFGWARIGGDRIYWWATHNQPAGGADGDVITNLFTIFGWWFAPIPELIRATQPQHILRNDIVDRPPIFPWGRGRITLLGDAAHPTTPNLGQGACMAIEDSIVLAWRLRNVTDLPAALRAYESKRHPRAVMIIRQSRRLGRIGQVSSPVLCKLRDAVFSAVPSSLMMRSHRALAGFEA